MTNLPVSDQLRHKLETQAEQEGISIETLLENRLSTPYAHTILNGLTAQTALLDTDGTILMVNQAWRDFAQNNGGRADRVAEGVNYLRICDSASDKFADEAQAMSRGIRQVIAGELPSFNLEYPCHSPTEQRWFMARVTVSNSDGHRQVIVSHELITKERQAVNALRASELRYRTLYELASDAILTVLPEHGDVIDANLAAQKLLGYSRAEITTLNRHGFVAPDPIIADVDQRMALLESSSQYETETVWLHKDGTRIDVAVMAKEIKIGDEYYIQIMGRDITERKRTHELEQQGAMLTLQLEKEQAITRQRAQMLTLLSHELRTPLAIISSSSEILNRHYGKLSEERRRDKTTQIFEQVHHLALLLDEINQLNAADRGFLHFNPADVDVTELCRAIISEMKAVVGENLPLQLNVALQNRVAYLDKNLLFHALTNLLSNAIKYSPDASDITLSVSQSDENLIFDVKDHGIGIPEADLPNLFVPFARASNIGEIRGTGLGLAMVKEVVDLHGGLITIESTPGEGSLFRIQLPRRQTE